jgi:hypothetical protein
MASLPLAWRNAVRDSDLDSMAKLAGHTLSTFMDSRGRAFPGLTTLAAGASVDVRTLKRAIGRLELRGFLNVQRTKGGRLARGKSATNRYFATLPTGAMSASVNGDTGAPVEISNGKFNGDTGCSSTGSFDALLTGASAPPEVEETEIEKDEGDNTEETAQTMNLNFLPCVEPGCHELRAHKDRCGPHATLYMLVGNPIKSLDDVIGGAA